MATITATNMQGGGAKVVTETTLTGTADTFTYNPGKEPVLIFRNDTAGALSPIIDGDGASTVAVRGVGSVDISAGFDGIGSMAAGAVASVELNTISQYLSGTIAITGGTGLVAQLLEF